MNIDHLKQLLSASPSPDPASSDAATTLRSKISHYLQHQTQLPQAVQDENVQVQHSNIRRLSTISSIATVHKQHQASALVTAKQPAYNQLLEERNHLSAVVQQLEHDLQQYHHTVQHLQAEHEQQHLSIKTLQQANHFQQHSAKQQVQQLTSTLTELQAEHQNLSHDYLQLRKLYVTEKTDADEVQQQLHHWQQQCEALQEEKRTRESEAQSELAATTAKCSELQYQYADLQHQHTALQQHASDLQQQLDVHYSNQSEFTTLIEELQHANRELTAECQALDVDKLAFQRTIAEKAGTIADLYASVARQRSIDDEHNLHEQLHRQAEELQHNYQLQTTLRQAEISHKAKLHELNQQLQQEKLTIVKQASKLRQQAYALKRITEQQSEATPADNASMLSTVNQSLLNIADALQHQPPTDANTVTVSNNQLTHLCNQLVELGEQLEATQSQLTDKTAVSGTLQQQLTLVTAALAELHDVHSASLDELDELRQIASHAHVEAEFQRRRMEYEEWQKQREAELELERQKREYELRQKQAADHDAEVVLQRKVNRCSKIIAAESAALLSVIRSLQKHQPLNVMDLAPISLPIDISSWSLQRLADDMQVNAGNVKSVRQFFIDQHNSRVVMDDACLMQ